jgi:hypothetical protein
MTGLQAVQQVLARVLERNNSPVAQLAAGTGPTAVTIETPDQILTYLNEGAQILARSPVLQIRGTATVPVVSGTARYALAGLTTNPTSRTLWSVRSAKLTITATSAIFHPGIAGIANLELYYPQGTEAGTPRYVFDGSTFVHLGPIPDADASLILYGLLLPKTIVSGSSIEDIPDVLLHHLIAFGCWRVCQQNLSNERFAASLPFWAAEITPWAGDVLGLKAGV